MFSIKLTFLDLYSFPISASKTVHESSLHDIRKTFTVLSLNLVIFDSLVHDSHIHNHKSQTFLLSRFLEKLRNSVYENCTI